MCSIIILQKLFEKVSVRLKIHIVIYLYPRLGDLRSFLGLLEPISSSSCVSRKPLEEVMFKTLVMLLVAIGSRATSVSEDLA